MINRNTILTGIAAILMIALVLPWICFTAKAQTDTTFTPTDKFNIPANNSTINFATWGTYVRASLENDTWNFVDLRLNNSDGWEKQTLRVSAQDSNVTILSYSSPHTTFGTTRLGYIVTGQGTQTFKFGLNPKRGEWNVTFNGKSMGKNDGWCVSPDARVLTITGATSYVTISHSGLPDSFGDNGNSSNQPIYQQHSVVIITAVAVTITVFLTAAIRRKNKELLD